MTSHSKVISRGSVSVPFSPTGIQYFLQPAIRKFVTMDAFQYLSVLPVVCPEGLARPHPTKYEHGMWPPDSLQQLLTNQIYHYCISASH
jgi:hypothetical protein